MTREFRYQVSLVFNVILAIAVVALAFHKSERSLSPVTREVRSEKITRETPTFTGQPKLPMPRYPDSTSPSDRRRWLVDQFRAAGVPNAVLARMVMADLDDAWDRRLEEVMLKTQGNPDAITAFQQQREREKEAEMRAALGEEGFRQWDQGNMIREANMGKISLSESEANAIYDFKVKLRERTRELDEARLKGEMDDAGINAASDKAYSEFNQQMKTLLGDDRYAQSQGVDTGAAAANLRQDLAKANPSDSQFQELLKAQQQWNDRRSDLDKQFQDNQSSAAYADAVKALDEVRDQEYRRVLGTNVFDTFQKEQDPGYSRMKKCQGLWGLDDNKIDYVYGAVKYYEKSVVDYQSRARALEAQGQSVDWNAVNKNLQQFAQQTQQTLQSYLGDDSFTKLQRNGVFQFNEVRHH